MADAAIHGHDHEDDRGFFTRWFMSTNHKDIGILYLFVAGAVGFISVAFTVYMRLELMEPGVQYMCLEGARFIANAAAECTPNGHLWNVMITYHGVLMMFFVVIPALFGGFGKTCLSGCMWLVRHWVWRQCWRLVAMASSVLASAGFFTRRCPRPRAVCPWTLRSLRFTFPVRLRSLARST